MAVTRAGYARSRARWLVLPSGTDPSGEMWVIAVLPGHIGRGIGGALLEKVEPWLFSEGCWELWLTTDVDTRLRAYSFYKKHGWTDWKIENGLRYLRKTSNHAFQPTPLARRG